MGDFLMPSLGADMVEGRLIQWRVAPGDVVAKGDIVAVVDTSKAEIEVEIFEAGVIEELVVDPGEKVAVGAVLAHVRSTVAATRPPVAPEPTAAEPVSTATGPAPAQGEREPRPIAPEPTAAEPAPP
ncbi:MAG: hypothetical protein LT070_07855, partial [Solirubrobacteraceae bacterium]|nr:hypothetical protein [Solirubrobacteraceae bacterium]